MRDLALAAALVLVAAPSLAECPSAETADAFIAAAEAAEPAPPLLPEGATLEDGFCAQDMVLERLIPRLGPVVGWKAGLTSDKAQAAFGVTEPVLGTLLRDMILKDGAVVHPADAVRPLFEADLIVEVGDSAIMEAETPEEVLDHIAGVRPFLELPALYVAKEVKLDGPAITAIDVGAWKGVMGDLIEVPKCAEGVAMLADMTAKLTDAQGAELSAVPGKAVLGNPLNAVLWVRDMLAERGESMKPGDLISVGSIGPLHPMKQGMAVTLTYEGLPGTPAISASFE